MRRALTALLLVACGPPPPEVPPPADHTPAFVRDHALVPGCSECHGPDPCARCHTTRPPRDHGPGFAAGPHAFAARADPVRCAACHTGPTCARCHR